MQKQCIHTGRRDADPVGAPVRHAATYSVGVLQPQPDMMLSQPPSHQLQAENEHNQQEVCSTCASSHHLLPYVLRMHPAGSYKNDIIDDRVSCVQVCANTDSETSNNNGQGAKCLCHSFCLHIECPSALRCKEQLCFSFGLCW